MRYLLAIFNGSSRGRLPVANGIHCENIYFAITFKTYRKNYQAIWTEQSSPLLAISRQQKTHYKPILDTQNINVQVEIAMTYGNPSIQVQ